VEDRTGELEGGAEIEKVNRVAVGVEFQGGRVAGSTGKMDAFPTPATLAASVPGGVGPENGRGGSVVEGVV